MGENAMYQTVCKEMMDEVVEEEIVELLEEAIIEIESKSLVDKEERTDSYDYEVIQEVAVALIGEVLAEEFIALSEECFDVTIAAHLKNSKAVQILNEMLRDITQEIMGEVALEVMGSDGSKLMAEWIMESVVRDTVVEECQVTAAKNVDHYRARVALLQYKQMQVSASNAILDTFLLEALLSKYGVRDSGTESLLMENHEHDSVVDQMVLEVLLSQTTALHACLHQGKPLTTSKHSPTSPRQQMDCLPLKWYKKKLTSAIAEDVVISLLCDRLDESVQIAAENEAKDQAASLFTRFINDP